MNWDLSMSWTRTIERKLRYKNTNPEINYKKKKKKTFSVAGVCILLIEYVLSIYIFIKKKYKYKKWLSPIQMLTKTYLLNKKKKKSWLRKEGSIWSPSSNNNFHFSNTFIHTFLFTRISKKFKKLKKTILKPTYQMHPIMLYGWVIILHWQIIRVAIASSVNCYSSPIFIQKKKYCIFLTFWKFYHSPLFCFRLL